MAPEPQPTVETVKDFWEGHVNNEYYTDAARASDEYFREIEDRRYATHYHLAELFASLAGSHGKLLEVGCGIGVDSIQLAKCGFDVTAVDLTENALEVAREFAKRSGVTIDFRLGNAEGLDFPDETFDAVYSFGVLHHTPGHREGRGGGAPRAQARRDGVRDALRPGLRRERGPQDVPPAVRVPRDRKDHCPVVYTYSRSGVKHLFGSFSDVAVHTDYPFTYGFGPAHDEDPAPGRRALGRAVGWHLMITARR